MIHIKFDAYWTMYTEFLSILFFMAKCLKWQPRHIHTVTSKRNILLSFDPKGIKSTRSNFHENLIKSLGGVCESTQRVNHQKWLFDLKWPTSC